MFCPKIRFRSFWVPSRRQLSHPDVKGPLSEAPGQVTTGWAVFHAGAVQVTCTHARTQRQSFLSRSCDERRAFLSARVASDTITTWFPSHSTSWVCCINNRETSQKQPHTSKMPSTFYQTQLLLMNIFTWTLVCLFISAWVIAIAWLCHCCSGRTTRITPWSLDCTSGSTLHSTASKDHLSALRSARQTAPAESRIASASQEGMTFLSIKKLESHLQQDSSPFSLQHEQPFYLKYLFVWMDEII